MSKEYNITTITLWDFFIRLLFFFVLSTVTGIYIHNKAILIFLVLTVIAIHIFFYKRLIWKKEITVQLTDTSVNILENNTQINFNEILWFRVDTNNAIANDLLLGVKGRRTIHFKTFKSGPERDNWTELKNDLLPILKALPSLRNYYDSPSWTFILRMILASWIIVPVIIYFLPVKFTAMLPAIGGWFAVSLSFYVSVSKEKERNF